MNKEEIKYLELFNTLKKPLDLLIIGQDPYPQKAMGIAFCKHSKNDLFSENCSGKHLLNSLGITEVNTKKFENTEDIFYYLLQNGIAIINISNVILNGKFINGQSKDEFNRKLFIDNQASILHRRDYNLNFIKSAKKIIILGSWKTEPIFKKFYPKYKINKTIIHPSNYNSQDLNKRKEWESKYKSRFLLNYFKNVC